MKKYNILMLMADQFRCDWMGCAGNKFTDTPNIDGIAKRGVLFSRSTCNSPLCAPSRAALAAGVYPHRLGVLSNNENFPADYPTYYQALRKNGYRVGAAGKTDLHKPDHFYGENGDLPVMYHLGFTDVVDTEGKMNAARFGPSNKVSGPYQKFLQEHGMLDGFMADYHQRIKNLPVWYSSASVLSEEYYHDSFIGRAACEFIKNVPDESPWHLHVSFVGPHDPWDAPENYLAKYADRSFPASIEDDMAGKPCWVTEKRDKFSKDMSKDDILRVKQNYTAMVKLLDDKIGEILAVLEAKGQRENTVIIFCSDHGEMLGDHGLFRKGFMYESAVRIPLIISLPEMNYGRKSGALAELMDLAPTILDLAGVTYDAGKFDGESLMPVLEGRDAHKDCQISQLYNTRMIFDGRYKYIESYNDINELYDLKSDPDELCNIINDYPDVARELTRQLIQKTK